MYIFNVVYGISKICYLLKSNSATTAYYDIILHLAFYKGCVTGMLCLYHN